MSDKPKRRWFRFSLLTAVLLMMAAGGIMWANSYMHSTESDYYKLSGRGWPFICWPYLLTHKVDIANSSFFASGTAIYSKLALNIFTGVAILAAVAFVSEFLIRRREGRKP